MSRVLCFALQSVRHLSGCAVADTFYRSTLRRFSVEQSDEPPSDVGLHELSASDVHGLPYHHDNRWALTPPSHPYRRAVRNLAAAVLFFCTNSPLQTTSH